MPAARPHDPTHTTPGPPSRRRGHPQLDAAVKVAQHEWDEHGLPEARLLDRQVAAARRELAKLTPAADAEHLERIRARSTERSPSLDRGLGL